jgi:hypothetical protein
VRKLFKHFDIPYQSIDLDSAEYQKENWGGGCTETFDAFND